MVLLIRALLLAVAAAKVTTFGTCPTTYTTTSFSSQD